MLQIPVVAPVLCLNCRDVNLVWVIAPLLICRKIYVQAQITGMASAQKWLNAIRQALLPPQTPQDRTSGSQSGPETPEEVQQAQQIAFEFSQLYQFNQQEELGCGQFGTVYGGVHRRFSHCRDVTVFSTVI